nr:hypothetical protein [Tanacetum cinerariifolium]
MYFEDGHQIMKFLKGLLYQIWKIVDVPKVMDEESSISQLVYVPNELIHRIQSLLPAKDAARTCVLSKSWLHAWSTIPTLRFTTCANDDHLTEEEETNYNKLIDRTLLRYLNDNMSIECLHLHLYMHNSSLSSLAEKWLHSLASRNCLKELSLTICGKKVCLGYRISNLTIPAEIFSCEKLNIVSLIVDPRAKPVTVNMNLVMIKCLFLRVLELVNVRISSE